MLSRVTTQRRMPRETPVGALLGESVMAGDMALTPIQAPAAASALCALSGWSITVP
jgi:hypothetical protein